MSFIVWTCTRKLFFVVYCGLVSFQYEVMLFVVGENSVNNVKDRGRENANFIPHAIPEIELDYIPFGSSFKFENSSFYLIQLSDFCINYDLCKIIL